MSIHLHYANQLEALLEPLAANLAGERADWRRYFEPATIIIPGKQVETFLKLRTADRMGAVGHWNTLFLRRFLREAVTAAQPGLRILERDELRSLLLAELGTLDDTAVVAPVRRYLYAAGDDDAYERRRYALADRLANLFLEYTFSRETWIEAWRKGALRHAGKPAAATEAWQAALFRKIDTRTDARFLTDVWLQGEEASNFKLQTSNLPPAIHVFGLSYIGRAFQQIFRRLGDHTDLHIYALNPCMEYWEDIDTSRWRLAEAQNRFARRDERVADRELEELEDPFALDNLRDTAALRLWGRPGRENVRLLNQLTECNFHAHFTDPTSEGATLLTRLQRDILTREPDQLVSPSQGERAGAKTGKGVDTSIRITAAPSLRREVETVAEQIWTLAERGVPFHHMAVLVPPAARADYALQIAAVFEAMHGIPFSLSEMGAGGESRIVEAIQTLLALPFGNYGRGDLLRLLTHPCLTAPFPEADADRWMRWAERLAVVFERDRRGLDGTYIRKDLYNWDQALHRLNLGVWMAGERSGVDAVFQEAADAYLVEDVTGGEQAAAGRFILLARSLMADADDCRAPRRRTLKEWATYLIRMVSTYLTPLDDDDRHLFERSLKRLDALADADLTSEEIPYRIAYEAAVESLGSLERSRGHYLVDGVAVSPYAPVPFRVVFMLGLGEGVFPGADGNDPLDLRHAQRMAGDVSTRERDKYAFLEALLAAREALHLSYVCRDGLTGDERQPSSLIAELRSILTRNYLSEEEYAALVTVAPLRRHARPGPLHDAARAEQQVEALRASLRAVLPTGAPVPPDEVLRGITEPAAWPSVAKLLRLPAPPTTPAAARPKLRIGLSALRAFLESPVQGWAKVVLGLTEDDAADPFAQTDEVLTPEGIFRAELVRRSFWAAPHDAAAAREAYQERYARMELAGTMPTGLFAEPTQRAHAAVHQEWRRQFGLVGDDGDGWATIVFGTGAAQDAATRVVSPLVFEVATPTGPVSVELIGETDPVSAAHDRTVYLKAGKWPSSPTPELFLRGFLTHVALTAAGLVSPDRFTVHLMCAPGAKHLETFTRVFTPLAPAQARAYLQALVTDLVTARHDYFFTAKAACEALFEDECSIGEALRDALQTSLEWGAKTYGPVSRPERFSPPADAEAEAILARRYALYKEIWLGKPEKQKKEPAPKKPSAKGEGKAK